MAAHFHRENDLILLQVKPENAPSGWKPQHAYNLTSGRTIPASTYAKFVVDTASSLGQQGDKGFFKNQAQTHIAKALDTLYEIRADVTLENAYSLLLDEKDMNEALSDLLGCYATERRNALYDHFKNRFLNQPPEQIGGVRKPLRTTSSIFFRRKSRRSSVRRKTLSTSLKSTAAKSSASRCRRNFSPSGVM